MQLGLYKHVVWDWNGTLLDDAALCNDIVNGILRTYSLKEVTVEDYRRNFEFPVVDYYKRLGLDVTGASSDEIARIYVDEYWARWKSCSLHSNVKATMEKLKDKGITTSILSASKQEPLDAYVEYFGLKDQMTACVGIHNHYADGKIEEGKRWVSEQFIEPNEILMVGDTCHDAEVAEAMGVACVLVSHGHNERQKLEKCGVPVIDHFCEFLIES